MALREHLTRAGVHAGEHVAERAGLDSPTEAEHLGATPEPLPVGLDQTTLTLTPGGDRRQVVTLPTARQLGDTQHAT